MMRFPAALKPAPAGLLALLLCGVVFWSAPTAAQQAAPSNAESMSAMPMGSQDDTRGAAPGAASMMMEGEWNDSGPVDHIAAPFPKPRPPSTRVHVTVLDVTPDLRRAGHVAVLLTRYRKRELEEHIGMKISLSNISGFSTPPERVNVLYYRPGFMRAAMLIAKAIPGEQNVAPMKPDLEKKRGIDVEVVLGKDVNGM